MIFSFSHAVWREWPREGQQKKVSPSIAMVNKEAQEENNILAEGAMALSMTLDGGALFAS